jgi:hypothetical protein
MPLTWIIHDTHVINRETMLRARAMAISSVIYAWVFTADGGVIWGFSS